MLIFFPTGYVIKSTLLFLERAIKFDLNLTEEPLFKKNGVAAIAKIFLLGFIRISTIVVGLQLD